LALPTKGYTLDIRCYEVIHFDMSQVNRISTKVAMTTNKKPILFRVQPELRPVLDDLARAQNRSLSNLIETAVVDWLRQNGHFPRKKK
jgi:hypothetical protein